MAPVTPAVILSEGALIRLILVLIALLLPHGDAHGLLASPPSPDADDTNSSGPYCGVWCVNTSMRLAGRNISAESLFKPEYTGSSKGSSIQELCRAGRENGMSVIPLANLTADSLRQSPNPMILHVKGERSEVAYDHFILYMGTENGKAVLFDPPAAPRQVEFRWLAPRWDGQAIAISGQPICGWRYVTTHIVRWGVVIGGLFLGAIVCRLFRWQGLAIGGKSGYRLALIECGLIAMFALTIAFTWGMFADEGFFSQADTLLELDRTMKAQAIPVISAADVRERSTPDTVFVDARSSADFQDGHIGDAINIPVVMTEVERKSELRNIDADRPIVVYCQSNGCPYGETVARRLIFEGFTNVSLFREGWVAWSSQAAGAQP